VEIVPVFLMLINWGCLVIMSRLKSSRLRDENVNFAEQKVMEHQVGSFSKVQIIIHHEHKYIVKPLFAIIVT
jgi:hypothetical protein